MSHELKTPLANIREGTELLMDGAVGELDTGQREVTAHPAGERHQAAAHDREPAELQRLADQQRAASSSSEFRLRPLVKQVLENQQLTLVSQRVRLDVQVEDLTLRRTAASCA